MKIPKDIEFLIYLIVGCIPWTLLVFINQILGITGFLIQLIALTGLFKSIDSKLR